MPALVGYNSVAASVFLMWKRSIVHQLIHKRNCTYVSSKPSAFYFYVLLFFLLDVFLLRELGLVLEGTAVFDHGCHNPLGEKGQWCVKITPREIHSVCFKDV